MGIGTFNTVYMDDLYRDALGTLYRYDGRILTIHPPKIIYFRDYISSLKDPKWKFDSNIENYKHGSIQ